LSNYLEAEKWAYDRWPENIKLNLNLAKFFSNNIKNASFPILLIEGKVQTDQTLEVEGIVYGCDKSEKFYILNLKEGTLATFTISKN